MDRMPRGPSPRHEPMFNAPAVVVALALALIAIYAAFDWASPGVQDAVIEEFAFVPGRLTVSFWPVEAMPALNGGPRLWTLLTYAFLHGSWTHVLLNTIWLVAFGPPVARRFGTARFLVFMALTAIVSALAQWASAPMEFAPLIGASGADSGLMGAALRFIFQPGGPLSAPGFGEVDAVETARPASLRGILADRRARLFLAAWLVTNFVFGAFARPLGLSDMPVAWIAHLGGFFAGMLLFPLFDRPPRPPAMQPY
ncbi:MAG TPA: rhomboid family intramembrane serine protease [Roseiarcus sp.]|nr:rhomboid family intramembrane serine protease [Roseiarcus sp.]